MSNFEKFPSLGNDEAEEKKIEEEGGVIDEFEGDENKIENKEGETEDSNKSKSKGGKRSGFMVGALSALALATGVGAKEAPQSADAMFAAKDKNTSEQIIKSDMESEENSQEKTEWKARVVKADTILTDSQFAEITDSSGMVAVPDLVSRIMRYTPGIYYIGEKDLKTTLRIQEEARMGRIDGDITIYVIDQYLYAQVTRITDDKGKTSDVRTGAGKVQHSFPLEDIKKIKFVFVSK
jgi:hypothetical protein